MKQIKNNFEPSDSQIEWNMAQEEMRTIAMIRLECENYAFEVRSGKYSSGNKLYSSMRSLFDAIRPVIADNITIMYPNTANSSPAIIFAIYVTPTIAIPIMLPFINVDLPPIRDVTFSSNSILSRLIIIIPTMIDTNILYMNAAARFNTSPPAVIFIKIIYMYIAIPVAIKYSKLKFIALSNFLLVLINLTMF